MNCNKVNISQFQNIFLDYEIEKAKLHVQRNKSLITQIYYIDKICCQTFKKVVIEYQNS